MVRPKKKSRQRGAHRKAIKKHAENASIVIVLLGIILVSMGKQIFFMNSPSEVDED